MCRITYLVISGLVFAIVALGHLARLVYHLPLQLGQWSAPMWLSGVGVVVAAVLSGWAFSLLCRKCE
jgi:hypothetical protein